MKFKKENQTKYLLCLIAVIAAAGAAMMLQENPEEITDGVLRRPDYKETAQSAAIDVYAEGEEKPFYVELDIQPRQYDSTQIEEVFETVYEQVLGLMKAENESLSKVTEDLYLPTSVEDYPITIEWYSSTYDLIDYDGSVYNCGFASGETQTAELTMVLSYEGYRCQYSVDIVVCEPGMNSYIQKQAGVEAVLKALEQEDTGDSIQLPETILGMKVHYRYAKEKFSPFFGVLILFVVPGLLYLKKYENQVRQKKSRREQLTYDYSEVISKLTLLAGAGMTIRGAWEKMALDYKKSSEKQEKRYVYEEMLRACMEMESGISERCAYERFGRRCDTKEYLKLASLLSQNVKKGTTDILRLLEEESLAAFEIHKNLAKRKGEEAGTKLLIPMILMLIIVMVMMMFPAAMSFGIL